MHNYCGIVICLQNEAKVEGSEDKKQEEDSSWSCTVL